MRYVNGTCKQIETPDVDAFLVAVADLCRAHGLSISHEDGQGDFIIEPYHDRNIRWLTAASVPSDYEAKPPRTASADLVTNDAQRAADAEAYCAWARARALRTSGSAVRAEISARDARYNVEQGLSQFAAFRALLHHGAAVETLLKKVADGERATGPIVK